MGDGLIPDEKALSFLQSVPVREFRGRRMGLSLIPIGCCRDIRVLLEIAFLPAPAEVLHGHFQILLETDGIRDMPSIQWPLLYQQG